MLELPIALDLHIEARTFTFVPNSKFENQILKRRSRLTANPPAGGEAQKSNFDVGMHGLDKSAH